MTLYKRRERFSSLSNRIGTAFSRMKISPNKWTLISLIPALVTMYFLFEESFLLATVFFGISSFLDLVDGSVARVTNRATKFGAYLDTVVDRYVEGIVLFGLIFAGLPDFVFPAAAWIFLILFGSLLTTYSKAAAKEKEIIEKGSELRGGILERAERLMILFLGLILAYFDKTYLTYIIVLLALLTNISALQRIRAARKLCVQASNTGSQSPLSPPNK